MPTLKQATQLVKLLGQPGALTAFRTWKPFSITSFKMLQTLRRLGLRPSTVIDGGANIGQFARAAAETFPEARVLSFEALPEVAARLRTNLADCPHATPFESALGSHDGTLRFFRSAYDLASSALPSASEDGEELEVSVGRLDTLLASEALRAPVLLKLDLQGYELEALRGAPETLARTDHVLLEIAFESAYVGEASFGELYEFLREAGFCFRRPIDFLTDDGGAIVQMDALFEREAIARKR